MAFEKVDPKTDFPAGEREVLRFWDETRAFETLRRKNAGKAPWSFLDGPITANNPMGVHHAWGRTFKDVFQRYHAAIGHDLRYQNGFDCQGLWIEVEVEKQHGFESKRDIEVYGIGKFVEECKARARQFAAIQTEQSKRLGYWMDWDNSYYTMSDANNYAIWYFLRQCHDEGLIYKGADVMAWCARCGTGISQMEMNEGYRETVHLSVFVRLPLRGRDGEYLLVWTTTPWTLTSNVAAAVRPTMKYLKIEQGDDVYYVGKGNFEASRRHPVDRADRSDVPGLMSINAIFNNLGGYEVVGELSGSDMLGWTYDGPFDHLPGVADARQAHQVIEWDQVTESEGSGIVHIAPGCGSEDYHLAKPFSLPIVAPLTEGGTFQDDFGSYAGLLFSEVADDITADLKDRGLLVAKERYLHRYPHCWRCKRELVYRLVDEWFINMEWRERIKNATRSARWIPEWGMERELDWLRNMGDWMISKKRFWGLALPIWECDECGHFDVIAGREELQERAVCGWEDFDGHSPHRPWIDGVKIKCARCGHAPVSRIKDVGNPWLDASIVPFSTMGYFEDRAYWEKWFPADFVVEALPGQFRNWFYAMLAVSAKLVDRAPFKTLLGHGLVLDDQFQEMHKSKGNAIEFNEAADSIGVDVMRWMYCRHSVERNLAFGPVHADEVRKKVLLPLWNTYAFFCNYARLDGFDPQSPPVPVAERSDLDRWILSDLQLLIRTAHQEISNFNTLGFCTRAETFIDDLSTWYVRRSRRRFWKSEWSDDKRAAYGTLYEVLTTLTQLLAPIMVFVCERMYQNLVAGQVAGAAQSVHHLDYPPADEKLIDARLSDRMAAFLHVVSLARSARTASKLKVRQPLAQLVVVPGNDTERGAVEQFRDHLLEELNVKKVVVADSAGDRCTMTVDIDKKVVGPKVGRKMPALLTAIAEMDARAVAAQLATGASLTVSVDGATVTLDPAEVSVNKSYGADWAAAEDGATSVLLDKRLTTVLRQEGMARDVVRNVQNLRKEAQLNIEDRIVLSLQTESTDLRATIDAFFDYISAETLAIELIAAAVSDTGRSADVKIAGQRLTIALQKA